MLGKRSRILLGIRPISRVIAAKFSGEYPPWNWQFAPARKSFPRGNFIVFQPSIFRCYVTVSFREGYIRKEKNKQTNKQTTQVCWFCNSHHRPFSKTFSRKRKKPIWFFRFPEAPSPWPRCNPGLHGYSCCNIQRPSWRGVWSNIYINPKITLWQTNMAMENGPFEDVFSIWKWDFPLPC